MALHALTVESLAVESFHPLPQYPATTSPTVATDPKTEPPSPNNTCQPIETCTC